MVLFFETYPERVVVIGHFALRGTWPCTETVRGIFQGARGPPEIIIETSDDHPGVFNGGSSHHGFHYQVMV
jgi:hypothetical protein